MYFQDHNMDVNIYFSFLHFQNNIFISDSFFSYQYCYHEIYQVLYLHVMYFLVMISNIFSTEPENQNHLDQQITSDKKQEYSVQSILTFILIRQHSPQPILRS